MPMTNAEKSLETRKICSFGQTTMQPLSNFEPWQSWKLDLPILTVYHLVSAKRP